MAGRVKSRTTWAGIAGNWSFKGRAATYTGSENAADGIALSPDNLRSGRVSTRVCLSDTERCVGRILLAYDAETERYFSVGLGGDRYAYTVDVFIPRSLSDSGRLLGRPVGPEAPPQAAVSGR